MFVVRNLIKQQLTVTKCFVHAPVEVFASHSVISHVRAIPLLCHRTITQTTTQFAPATPVTGATNINENVSNTTDASDTGDSDTLTEYQAYDMIHKLNDNERASLSSALNKYDSEKIKSKFQGTGKWEIAWARYVYQQTENSAYVLIQKH